MAPSSRGLGRQILILQTGIRLPVGSLIIMFWENFWPNLASDSITTLLFGITVGYLLLRIQSKLDTTSDKKERKAKLKRTIDILYEEINYNRKQLQVMLREFKKINLPYPALEIGTWEVLDKKLILDGLNKEDIKNIINIYARAKTINTIYDELIKNSSWMLDKPKPIIKKEFFDMLADRCEELLDYINEVLPAEKV
jgi:hypothetical protein